MWEKVAKVVVWLLPIGQGIWRMMDKASKIVVVCIAFTALTIWAGVVSWATLRIEALNAFDTRFDSLYKEREIKRIESIKTLETDVGYIKNDVSEMKMDMREVRNILMRSPR